MRNYITSAFVLLFIAQGLLAQKSQVDSIADELRQRCSGITYEDQPQNIKDTFAFFVTRYKKECPGNITMDERKSTRVKHWLVWMDGSPLV